MSVKSIVKYYVILIKKGDIIIHYLIAFLSTINSKKHLVSIEVNIDKLYFSHQKKHNYYNVSLIVNAFKNDFTLFINFCLIECNIVEKVVLLNKRLCDCL